MIMQKTKFKRDGLIIDFIPHWPVTFFSTFVQMSQLTYIVNITS